MENSWQGIYAATATPFDSNGDLNEQEFARLIRFHLQQGLHGCFLGGATGEGIHLSDDELLRLCRIAVEQSGTQGKVIAHVGGRPTKQCARLAQQAATLGADAVGCILPLVYSYDFAAIEQHYRTIAQASDLPILIYCLPQVSGFALTDQQLEQLFSIPNLMGMKYSGTDLYQIPRLSFISDKVHIFSGEDKSMLGALAMGSKGAIGTTVNFMPRLYAMLYRAFCQGNWAQAQALQRKALRVLLIGRRDLHSVASCKAFLDMIGFKTGEPRAPLRGLNKQEFDGLNNRLKDIGFFDDNDYLAWNSLPNRT